VIVGRATQRAANWWMPRSVAGSAVAACPRTSPGGRSRPAIERGDGIYLCGDQVAAPGCWSEVSCASASEAAKLALQHAGGGVLRQVA